MTLSAAELARLDKKHVWHPFTQQAEWNIQEPLIIRSAKGSYLTDMNGRRYLDGVSSLWVTVHGHNHPALNRALVQQMKRMAHTTFLGLTHEPAIRLAKELIDAVPKGFSRVFYSDNGSTAVEVALKMAYQYWVQKTGSTRRNQFLALENSYHGDTLGSVSVGGISLFHSKFRPLLFKSRFAMSPNCYRCPFRKKDAPYAGRCRTNSGDAPISAPKPGDRREGETGCRWECLSSVENNLRQGRKRLAAMVVEPLVQGASGMIVMPPGYLKGVGRLCRKYGVLLIADEVATGFGRTGTMFASDREKVKPDFLCVAKSITGGYLPLAATLTTEKIYQAFLGKFEEFKTFFHGHTYTANPLACAVALENLNLYRKSRLLASLPRKINAIAETLLRLRYHPAVGDVRQIGMMAGIELVGDRRTGKPFPISWKVGQRVCAAARERGLWIRPLGDVIVLMPPLGITQSELLKMLHIVEESIAEVWTSVGKSSWR